MRDLIEIWQKNSKALNKKQSGFLKNIKAKESKTIDKLVIRYDEELFRLIDCLDCANCCKTISPILNENDVRKISKKLKVKDSQLFENFLMVDDEGDIIMQTTPCPFLMEDNKCSIYDARPKACREYPHTGHYGFSGRRMINIKNCLCCPVVFHIVEKLRTNKT